MCEVRKVGALAFGLGVLLCLVVVVGAAAQGMGQSSTGVQIQNLSTTDEAQCVLEYVNQDGSTQHSDPLTIAAGGSANRDTRADYSDAEIPSGWIGSLVIYCDQPVAAISNQYNGIWSSPYGSSNGFQQGALQVNLPLIMCNWAGWDTNFHVQNVGPAPTDVDVEYVPALAGVAYNNTLTDLQPSASRSVDQSTICNLIGGGTPKQFMGSVVLTADQPLVAVVNEESTSQMMKYTYDGFVKGSTKAYAPLVMARHANNYTSLQIQNTSTTDPVEVRITYRAETDYTMPAGLKGSTLVVTYTIPAGQTLVRYERDTGTACSTGTPPLGDLCEYQVFLGAATVESTGATPIVVTTNAQNDVVGRAAAYNGIADDDAGKEVLAPLVMHNNYGWLTSLQIQNVGTLSTTVTITYTADPLLSLPPGGTVVKTFDIDPGEMLVRYEQTGHPLSDLDSFTRFVGSVSISSDTEDIAVIVNEDYPAGVGDWLMSYNGFYP